MQATIISHEPVPASADASEIHRFTFILDDGNSIPRAQTVSLRTARILVAELPASDAFVRMLSVIVRTDAIDYDSLLGEIFTDDHPARPDAEPLDP